MKKKIEIMKRSDTPMTQVQCPQCKEIFGLNNRFMEKVAEANVHYTCPYCGICSGIKNE